MPALLVQFEPLGAWRNGPATGARERVDATLHSDTLFSAICHAASALGWIEEWLDATVGASGRAAAPEIRLSSLFPWQGNQLYLAPPRSVWPPETHGRLRVSGASLITPKALSTLLGGESLQADQWKPDGLSECLVPQGLGTGPFRVALRSRAAVDRQTPGHVDAHRTACLEFTENAGYWCAAEFSDAAADRRWRARLEGAFRWLGDSGLGGERSSGWGHSREVRFRAGELTELLGLPTSPESGAWWLLSVFLPAEADSVDWSVGNYQAISRGPQAAQMIAEGSVIVTARRPSGRTLETAPSISIPHATYRSGLALALPIALPGSAA